MTKRLPKKDVVIIGLGWAGSIMANELTDEGLVFMVGGSSEGTRSDLVEECYSRFGDSYAGS